MKEDLFFCKTLALGSLTQGYFHNLRGILQGAFLELQILLMKKDSLSAEELAVRLEKIFNLLKKLLQRLDIAYADINDTSLGPWDLKALLEETLGFWEADLVFKHNVLKEVVEEEKGEVSLPNNLVKGLFCGIGELLFLNLKQGKLVITIKGKSVEFNWDKPLELEILERLKAFLESFSSFIDFKLSRQNLTLRFMDG